MFGEAIEDSANCSGNRDRQLETKRLLFWCRRLNMMPDEVQQLSLEELQARHLLVQQAEGAHERRMEQFKRWQNLNQLRWLMYEEQRKYNEKCGQQAEGVSIWQILSLAQQELESELQMPELRGDCRRFPSPMSVMGTTREPGSNANILKPLRPIIAGLSSSEPWSPCPGNRLAELGPTEIHSKQFEAEEDLQLIEQNAKEDEIMHNENLFQRSAISRNFNQCYSINEKQTSVHSYVSNEHHKCQCNQWSGQELNPFVSTQFNVGKKMLQNENQLLQSPSSFNGNGNSNQMQNNSIDNDCGSPTIYEIFDDCLSLDNQLLEQEPTGVPSKQFPAEEELQLVEQKAKEDEIMHNEDLFERSAISGNLIQVDLINQRPSREVISVSSYRPKCQCNQWSEQELNRIVSTQSNTRGKMLRKENQLLRSSPSFYGISSLMLFDSMDGDFGSPNISDFSDDLSIRYELDDINRSVNHCERLMHMICAPYMESSTQHSQMNFLTSSQILSSGVPFLSSMKTKSESDSESEFTIDEWKNELIVHSNFRL
ncbi:uncharacterized protein [Drosophila virilis]|uniref:Uncharacterized protein n=1 Tax=Drosophila virilis TaxID=7244 RepID=A0A0Q9WJ33_DROVI|nr:uncharacterized protein LOC26531686 [Drosophila virilis]KRF84697.1 uncharacterized protein Dvir_GJ26916 [Drosophila virilis]